MPVIRKPDRTKNRSTPAQPKENSPKPAPRNSSTSVVDAATQQSYRVSGPELYRLISGEQPAAGAPDGYFYSGFGYLVTFSGGKITRLEQWWTP